MLVRYVKSEIINGELFHVEFYEGEKSTQEKLCNFLGHDLAEQDETKGTVTTKKGICRRCGHGLHYWKASKKESEMYQSETESLR